MNRRQLLKNSVFTAIGLGLSPGIIMSLESCAKERPSSDDPLYFNEEEFDTLWLMANIILPKTETPGAIEAGVPLFMDKLYGEFLEDDEKNKFQAGLKNFMATCKNENGEGFLDLDKESQISYLEKLDNAGAEEEFFKSSKQIILWAYFTSEAGMRSMNYLPVPGRYNGCISIDGEEKNIVGNR